jgi:hypothetical protein
VFILLTILRASWTYSFTDIINLGIFPSLLLQIFLLFLYLFLLLKSPLYVCFIFYSFPKVLGYFVLSFVFILLFALLFWKILLTFLQAYLSLPQFCAVYLSRHCLFVRVCMLLAFTFGSFLDIPSMCLHCHLFLHVA